MKFGSSVAVKVSPLALLALFSSALAGCGNSDPAKASTKGPSAPDTDSGVADPNRPADALSDLKSLPTPAGGLSFYTPKLKIAAGDDVTYCTYTNAITDKDYFIHQTFGTQNKMGHHTLLYYAATPSDERTEICSGLAMETLTQMIGGGAGEGTATWKPPANVGTVVPKGSQFVLQSHWINTSQEDIEVQAMMVTQPGTDGPDRIEAGTFAVVDVGFQVAPNSAGSTTTECVMDQDRHLLMTIGHEHEWGTHVRAEVTRLDGTVEQIFDRPFSPSDVFDPPMNGYDVEKPLTFLAGEKVRMSCDWQNTTDQPLGFPREMCVLFGFSMDPGDAHCVNGGWDTGGSSADAGASIPGPPCAKTGDPGNEHAVGKYCTKGGGECAGTDSTLCLADVTSGQFGDFCTMLCTDDAACGAGASCVGSAGSPKACIPTACTGGGDAGAAVP